MPGTGNTSTNNDLTLASITSVIVSSLAAPFNSTRPVRSSINYNMHTPDHRGLSLALMVHLTKSSIAVHHVAINGTQATSLSAPASLSHFFPSAALTLNTVNSIDPSSSIHTNMPVSTDLPHLPTGITRTSSQSTFLTSTSPRSSSSMTLYTPGLLSPPISPPNPSLPPA